jgi:hypothetical protein
MNIHFDFRVALHRSDREALRNKIVEIVNNWGEVGGIPARVTVLPVRFDPYDERVVIEIRSDSGELISSGLHIEPNELNIPDDSSVLSDNLNNRFASPKLQLSML